MKHFDRISIDPAILSGKACIRGLRISVHLILDLLATGQTHAQILTDYPDLTEPDILAAIEFGAFLAREESFPAA